MGAVGDPVEAMAGAEGPHRIMIPDVAADLLHRIEGDQLVRTVPVIAGPVGELACRRRIVVRSAEEPSPGNPTQGRRQEPQERPFIHDWSPELASRR